MVHAPSNQDCLFLPVTSTQPISKDRRSPPTCLQLPLQKKSLKINSTEQPWRPERAGLRSVGPSKRAHSTLSGPPARRAPLGGLGLQKPPRPEPGLRRGRRAVGGPAPTTLLAGRGQLSPLRASEGAPRSLSPSPVPHRQSPELRARAGGHVRARPRPAGKPHRAAPTQLRPPLLLRLRKPYRLGRLTRHVAPRRVTPSPRFPGGSAASRAGLTLAWWPCLLMAPTFPNCHRRGNPGTRGFLAPGEGQGWNFQDRAFLTGHRPLDPQRAWSAEPAP